MTEPPTTQQRAEHFVEQVLKAAQHTCCDRGVIVAALLEVAAILAHQDIVNDSSSTRLAFYVEALERLEQYVLGSPLPATSEGTH